MTANIDLTLADSLSEIEERSDLFDLFHVRPTPITWIDSYW